MPYKAPTPCNAFGCREVVRGRYCKRHQKEHARARKRDHDRARGSASARGYGAAWRRIRAAKLARDPFCEYRTHCPGDIGREVDHVDGDNTNNAPANLRTTCHACHSAKTVREQGVFGNPRATPPPAGRS